MHEGYEDFFSACFDPIRRSLTLAFGDAALAEDAAQEAFARAYRRWARVSAMDDPSAWVYVVAVNVARRARRRRPPPRLISERAGGTDVAGNVATSITAMTLLSQLTPRQRTAVVLRYLADLRYADIGRAMGCAETTARATVHQALQRLRADVKEDRDGS
jgi:RNA polymerase sigma-70 factor (ECF subfamily)